MRILRVGDEDSYGGGRMIIMERDEGFYGWVMRTPKEEG